MGSPKKISKERKALRRDMLPGRKLPGRKLPGERRSQERRAPRRKLLGQKSSRKKLRPVLECGNGFGSKEQGVGGFARIRIGIRMMTKRESSMSSLRHYVLDHDQARANMIQAE
jgi:hypothetical protein